MKNFMDKLLNWTGGTYVGLSTLVVLFLGVMEAKKHEWTAPDWLVGVPFGVYMVILTLYVAQKPVNTWIGTRGTQTPPPA